MIRNYHTTRSSKKIVCTAMIDGVQMVQPPSILENRCLAGEKICWNARPMVNDYTVFDAMGTPPPFQFVSLSLNDGVFECAFRSQCE